MCLRQHCTRKLIVWCWLRVHRHVFAGKLVVITRYSITGQSMLFLFSVGSGEFIYSFWANIGQNIKYSEASLLGFKFYGSPFFKLDCRTFELRKKSSVVFAEILPLFNFILNFGIFEYQKKFGKYIRKLNMNQICIYQWISDLWINNLHKKNHWAYFILKYFKDRLQFWLLHLWLNSDYLE